MPQYGQSTPQEILSQILTENDLIISQAQTPAQRRAARLRSFGRAAFAGLDPRMVNAREIETALSSTTKMEQFENESSLDFEIRQGRSAFEALREVDPGVASQINSQVTALEGERLNRQALQANISTSEYNLESKKEQAARDELDSNRASILRSNAHVFDFNNGDYLGSVGLEDEDFQDQVDKLAGDRPGAIPIGYEDLDMNMMAVVMQDQIPKSAFQAQLTEVQSATRFALAAEQLTAVLEGAWDEGQNALSDLSKAEGVANRIIGSVEQLERQHGATLGHEDGNTERMAAEWLRRNHSRSAMSSSLLTTMAYSLALAFNQRVTDADFEAAWNMIGGDSADPEAAINAINSQLLLQERGIEATFGIDMQNESYRSSPQGARLAPHYDSYMERSRGVRAANAAFLDRIGGEDLSDSTDRARRSTDRARALAVAAGVTRVQTFTVIPQGDD